jgi:rhodanese-related sulfurtransferase
MNTTRQNYTGFLSGLVAAVILTTFIIYVTPLKHLNIFPPAMSEIDPSEFYKEVTANPDRYIFVDVRGANDYGIAHPKGAINIRIADLSDPTVRSQLPRSGKQIVLTCTEGKLAAVAYGYLQNWGYLNLLHLTGGLEQWAIEGLPVEGARTSVGNE